MNTPPQITGETEPLSLEKFNQILDRVFRPKNEPKYEKFPRQVADLEKLRELRIKAFYEPSIDTYLTSFSEMKRARDGGAIWYEDEKGNRV